jgi:hypothetical protein
MADAETAQFRTRVADEFAPMQQFAMRPAELLD